MRSLISAAVVVLAACGGGGGSDTVANAATCKQVTDRANGVTQTRELCCTKGFEVQTVGDVVQNSCKL